MVLNRTMWLRLQSLFDQKEGGLLTSTRIDLAYRLIIAHVLLGLVFHCFMKCLGPYTSFSILLHSTGFLTIPLTYFYIIIC